MAREWARLTMHDSQQRYAVLGVVLLPLALVMTLVQLAVHGRAERRADAGHRRRGRVLLLLAPADPPGRRLARRGSGRSLGVVYLACRPWP